MRLVGFAAVVMLSLGIVACGSSDGGGGVDSEPEIRGMMQTIALDFAQVLADVAPSFDTASEKQTTTDCPQGGTAAWSGVSGGGGTLTLDQCQMRGVAISGTLSGFLERSVGSVSAIMMRGPVTFSGARSGSLNITDLVVSAQLPIADATTFWQIKAINSQGMEICAWSGGEGCGPSDL